MAFRARLNFDKYDQLSLLHEGIRNNQINMIQSLQPALVNSDSMPILALVKKITDVLINL